MGTNIAHADRLPLRSIRSEQLDVLAGIGNTPLVPLDRLGAFLPPAVRILAKAEHLNTGGSVKDRPATAIIRDVLRDGLGRRRLIDATSGNTGIAYAMTCARLGIPLTLAMPANASVERKATLRALGVDVILTPAIDGTDGSREFVRDLVARDPDRYAWLDQYSNEANWQSHFDGTGVEILEQTGGSVTHFAVALGTTGTFVGVSRRLKSHDPNIRCIAIQPDLPLHGIEGVKHLPTANVPAIFDPSLVDEQILVSTEEAFDMTRRLAAEEGLFVGISSGANVAAALRVGSQLDAGTVVTVLCDTGTRYLNGFWSST